MKCRCSYRSGVVVYRSRAGHGARGAAIKRKSMIAYSSVLADDQVNSLVNTDESVRQISGYVVAMRPTAVTIDPRAGDLQCRLAVDWLGKVHVRLKSGLRMLVSESLKYAQTCFSQRGPSQRSRSPRG